MLLVVRVTTYSGYLIIYLLLQKKIYIHLQYNPAFNKTALIF